MKILNEGLQDSVHFVKKTRTNRGNEILSDIKFRQGSLVVAMYYLGQIIPYLGQMLESKINDKK